MTQAKSNMLMQQLPSCKPTPPPRESNEESKIAGQVAAAFKKPYDIQELDPDFAIIKKLTGKRQSVEGFFKNFCDFCDEYDKPDPAAGVRKTGKKLP